MSKVVAYTGPNAIELWGAVMQGRQKKPGDETLLREIVRLKTNHDELLSALREYLHTERRPLDAKSTSLSEADMQEWFERRQRARENALALIARLSP
ncbi:hypothetical protein M0638_28240 [Roseomonas sp. NAR14]|uniref:Uncharacterized protein n=1 Tax=Roseomonas acroporae TaxID=2937791 RepID=A0A9X1YEJ2_9PROT|nr:hypothetical protein [Roseomonas acroporae]MCK8788245.1 hypothetical protein [Roseomonas acroporae]